VEESELTSSILKRIENIENIENFTENGDIPKEYS